MEVRFVKLRPRHKMRLPLVVLLVCAAGVCFCRPESDPPPPEDMCEEGDEECARQYPDDSDDNDREQDDDDQGHGMGDDMGDMDDVGGMEGMNEVDGMGGMDDMGDMVDISDGRGMGGMDMDEVDEMRDMLDMSGGDMDDDDDGDVVDDDGEYVTIKVDEEDDEEGEDDEDKDTTTTTTTVTDPSSSSSAFPSSPPPPTGPPKSRLTRTTPLDDLHTETTDTTTDSTSSSTDDTDTHPTTSDIPHAALPPAPTGPPVVHLARQGPKGIGLRRPEYGPFPTPLRKPNLIGLIGFTVRGANNTRTRGRVTFKNVLSNLGKGWKTSNTFRSPLFGLYYFSVHATSPRNSGFKLALAVDGKPQVFAYASSGYRHGSVSAMMRLKPGNRLSLELQRGALYEPGGNRAYTVLTGIIVGVDMRGQRGDRPFHIFFGK